MTGSKRRERRRSQRKAEIYTVALELFAERGFDEVTVADITRAADVAKGTFFNYFPTKEHLLVEYRNALFEAIHGYGESLEGTRARELFKRFFRRLARHVRSEGQRYTTLFREVVARPHLAELEASVSAPPGAYRRYFERFLRVGVESGEIPPDTDLGLLAETLRDLWGGTSLHWMLERPSASLERRLLRRVDLIFDLLERRPRTRRRATRSAGARPDRPRSR